MTSPDDELYDIHNRPANWELRVNMALGLTFYVALAGIAPLFLLHWLGVRQWALIGIPLAGALTAVCLALRSLKRRGIKAKALYAARGGNPDGTSDILFGQMNYSIEPDGRWKWPEQTYSDAS
ncbi:hypothetical protein [Pseudarthrobacter sp. fls2-241-R2A-127]|uniref:hypothetical protein n=1 Tax=Pseudarthrobacter sp. fls2-241-R2A-127 TaxID=3040303 RepID=UPI00255363CB|nr:hypothetical protein [Pseudarthrobacter sp. fls2-241-R2A-127]